jgi:hypothetical protein
VQQREDADVATKPSLSQKDWGYFLLLIIVLGFEGPVGYSQMTLQENCAQPSRLAQ